VHGRFTNKDLCGDLDQIRIRKQLLMHKLYNDRHGKGSRLWMTKKRLVCWHKGPHAIMMMSTPTFNKKHKAST
jgi:hypothetical protein